MLIALIGTVSPTLVLFLSGVGMRVSRSRCSAT
jgi:hypothetical protein